MVANGHYVCKNCFIAKWGYCQTNANFIGEESHDTEMGGNLMIFPNLAAWYSSADADRPANQQWR